MSSHGNPDQPASPGAPAAPPVARTPAEQALEEKIIKALRTVFDPEIPVNIYELGLIYGIDLLAGGRVTIRMTLTSPMCPEAQSLPLKVESVVGVLPEVNEVNVQIVWEPPWSPARMSDAAKLAAGLL